MLQRAIGFPIKRSGDVPEYPEGIRHILAHDDGFHIITQALLESPVPFERGTGREVFTDDDVKVSPMRSAQQEL